MFDKLFRSIFRRIFGSEMRYWQLKFYLEKKRELRQLKRDNYHLKELTAKDPNDPRVLLSKRCYMGPHPMSLGQGKAREVTNMFNEIDRENGEMVARFEAGEYGSVVTGSLPPAETDTTQENNDQS